MELGNYGVIEEIEVEREENMHFSFILQTE